MICAWTSDTFYAVGSLEPRDTNITAFEAAQGRISGLEAGGVQRY